MSKETILSVLRSLLTLGGTYLIGHNLFGLAVDSTSWQIWLGAIVTVASTVWGIFDKSTGIEQLQSALRSIVISVGGLFVAAGKLSQNTLDAILGLLVAIVPMIQSQTSKAKNQQIAAGTIVATAQGKTVTAVPPKS